MRELTQPTVRRWPVAVLLLAVAPLLFPAPLRTGAFSVRIGVFGLFRPQELALRAAPGGRLTITSAGEAVFLSGGETARLRLVDGGLECAVRGRRLHGSSLRVSLEEAAEFLLAVPGKIERRYRGSLEVTTVKGVLHPVVSMDLELAVASAVAAESPPGAPLEALKAQAVVSRSYYRAARGRHAGFDFCDTTHCQFLRHPPEQEDAAWLATAATGGLVLAYEDKVLSALYSASCGGRTRTLAEAGMNGQGYPYYSVVCRYCREHADSWERRLRADSLPLASPTSKERSQLELGRRFGWSTVPGNNYIAEQDGDEVVGRGRGAGHGIGLCQRGAAGMARGGADFLEILRHYYPNTVIRGF